MKLLLSILNFSVLIITLHLSKSQNVQDMQRYLNKYAKYVVYVCGRNHLFHHYFIGVIIQDDIVLTAYIPGGKNRRDGRVLEREFYNMTPTQDDDFLTYGRVVAGTRRFIIVTNIPKLSNAINFNPSLAVLPQLSLLKLRNKLILNNDLAIVPLPSRRYDINNGNCVSIGMDIGRFDFPLIVDKVILDDYCDDGIICFKRYVNNKVANHCEMYLGGEPIFCSGTFVALVNYIIDCDSNQPAKATSVYDKLIWIKAAKQQLNLYDVKCDCNTIVPMASSIFYIIYTFIKTIYNNIFVQ